MLHKKTWNLLTVKIICSKKSYLKLQLFTKDYYLLLHNCVQTNIHY